MLIKAVSSIGDEFVSDLYYVNKLDPNSAKVAFEEVKTSKDWMILGSDEEEEYGDSYSFACIAETREGRLLAIYSFEPNIAVYLCDDLGQTINPLTKKPNKKN